jgi:hypothetical protein
VESAELETSKVLARDRVRRLPRNSLSTPSFSDPIEWVEIFRERLRVSVTSKSSDKLPNEVN